MKQHDRRSELATALARVEQRVAAACSAAGRARDEITLIAVTKTYPASDVLHLAELGVGDIGENRHPEAGHKAADVQDAAPATPLRWHFLGGLQTNKAGAVARYADVVHSIDRVKLVGSLSRGAAAAERTLTGLVQVDLGPELGRPSDGRSGAVPDDVPALADAVAEAEGLQLGGVMTVAPLDVDPAAAFARLAEVAARVRADHPDAVTVSAGMSADLEQAVAAGATHLRVGRAILGDRPPLR